MTPGVIPDYTFTMPLAGKFELILNSDDEEYGGSNYLGGFDNKRIYETYEYIIYPESEDNELDELSDKSIRINLRDESDVDSEQKLNKGVDKELFDIDVGSITDTTDDQTDELEPIEIEHRLDIVVPPLCGMLFKWRREDQQKRKQIIKTINEMRCLHAKTTNDCYDFSRRTGFKTGSADRIYCKTGCTIRE